MTIKLKIGKHMFNISEKDRVVYNGAGAILETQTYFSGWHDCHPSLAKKLFKDLTMLGFLYTNEALAAQAKRVYKADYMTYYKFNIPAMFKAGYEVVAE